MNIGVKVKDIIIRKACYLYHISKTKELNKIVFIFQIRSVIYYKEALNVRIFFGFQKLICLYSLIYGPVKVVEFVDKSP